jgi:hypothetical protein
LFSILETTTKQHGGCPEYEMVNRDARDNVRKKLENDPDRDMSHVPGTYNPGNQAGKPVQGRGLRPADEPGGPFLGKGAGGKTPKINPGKTDTAVGKGEQAALKNQKR